MGVQPEPNPDVEDEAPTGPNITIYDKAHFATYLRLLDADKEGACWTKMARIVLRRDPATDPARTRRCWDSHLARARWITKICSRQVLDPGG